MATNPATARTGSAEPQAWDTLHPATVAMDELKGQVNWRQGCLEVGLGGRRTPDSRVPTFLGGVGFARVQACVANRVAGAGLGVWALRYPYQGRSACWLRGWRAEA